MVLHVDDDVEVSGGTATGPGFAFTSETEALSRRDAGRNTDAEFLFLLHAPGAATDLTGFGDDRAGAAALPARPRHGEEALLISDLSAPLALWARDWRRAGCCAVAFAGLADFLPGNLQRCLGAFRGFFEGDLEIVAEVCTALRTASPSAAEGVAEPEDVSEPAEDVLEAGERVGIEASGRRAAEPGVPEAVVHVPLVRVHEHGIRLGGFLEVVFGALVPGIAVGVIFERELAVRALDLDLG